MDNHPQADQSAEQAVVLSPKERKIAQVLWVPLMFAESVEELRAAHLALKKASPRVREAVRAAIVTTMSQSGFESPNRNQFI